MIIIVRIFVIGNLKCYVFKKSIVFSGYEMVRISSVFQKQPHKRCSNIGRIDPHSIPQYIVIVEDSVGVKTKFQQYIYCFDNIITMHIFNCYRLNFRIKSVAIFTKAVICKRNCQNCKFFSC